MKLLEIISEEAVYNILAHCKACWDYTYPTGKALEEAVYRGLAPFYNEVKSMGASNTIIDVLRGTDAFDIKGSKSLSYPQKIASVDPVTATNPSNVVEQRLIRSKELTESIQVKIPLSITTMIQRPNTDMENWQGDPATIIHASLDSYKSFAEKTTAAGGCTTLYSLVVLYGEDVEKGYRSVYITLEDFYIPQIASAQHYQNSSGQNAGCDGLDSNGTVVYSLMPINRGSVNSLKRFDTSQGILYSWAAPTKPPIVYSKAFLEKEGVITKISSASRSE